MLEDAVTRLKGEGETLRTETEMNLGLPAHIPDTYIGDGRERLKYYKMLSSAPDGSARQEVVMELRDRFGPLPEELETFVSVLASSGRSTGLASPGRIFFRTEFALPGPMARAASGPRLWCA